MKKTIVMTLILTVLAAGLTACQNAQEQKKETEVIDFEELTSKMEESKLEISELKALAEKADGVSTKQRYKNFLEGEGQLYFNQYMPNGYEAIKFETTKGYTMFELLTILEEKYTDVDIDMEIDYAYLDCGNDGVEELAIRFNGISNEGPEISTQVYVMKEIEGKLECCYYYETWSRSHTDINCYGYVTSFGSNGASNHGYDAGYIDADGKWNFIHYTEEEWNIDGLFCDGTLGKVPDIAAGKQYEGNIVVTTTRFEEILTDEDFYNMEKYYAFYVDGVESDVYSDSVYKDIFDEAGVKLYQPKEIDAMIQEKEASLGITDEIKQGADVSWETLQSI